MKRKSSASFQTVTLSDGSRGPRLEIWKNSKTLKPRIKLRTPKNLKREKNGSVQPEASKSARSYPTQPLPGRCDFVSRKTSQLC